MVENIPKYRELKSPIAVQTELTPKCNNVCGYCYNSWRGNTQLESELNLKNHLKIAQEIVNNEVFETVLTGGEPLLRRDLLYPLANFYSKKNLEISFNTNLILINSEDILKIKDSGILGVLGSLPSCDKETYNLITQTKNFEKAIKGIELLVNGKIPLAINMVVLKSNKHQVYETGKFIHNMGVHNFCGTPASPSKYLKKKDELLIPEILNTLDDLLRLQEDFGMSVDIVEPLPRCITKEPKKYEQFFKRDCAAGKLTAVISSSGNIRPCTHVPLEYGNILREGLSTLWKKMQDWRNGSMTPNECGTCDETFICSMGCREVSKLKHDNYKTIDPWCNPNNAKERTFFLKEINLKDHETYKIQPNIKYRNEENKFEKYFKENV